MVEIIFVRFTTGGVAMFAVDEIPLFARLLALGQAIGNRLDQFQPLRRSLLVNLIRYEIWELGPSGT
ncbi:MAG TPA: hypothetical protein VJH03_13595 [Blastocatellia bacterium]|nr:hypothetical protein [Blastocatellia bacterium]